MGGEMTLRFERQGDGTFAWRIGKVTFYGLDTSGTEWERQIKHGSVDAPAVTGATTIAQLRAAIVAAVKAEVVEL
jgi:hypothetical protein